MTRALLISSAGGEMTLDGSKGVRAGLRVRGMGMPGVELQWFDGAGDGASYRGGRTLPRTLDMPVTVRGADRAEVLRNFAAFARILSRENAPVTVTAEFDDAHWRLLVVRTGGGDFTFGEDSDGSTYVQTVLTVQTDGAPYWTRVDGEGRRIEPGGLGLGLLGPGQSLVQLILSSTDGFGEVTFSNSGDVGALPVWTFFAPFDGFAIARDGLALEWVGASRKTSGWIRVDAAKGTVEDETGADRYAELDPAPRFFTIPVGTSTVSVVMGGAAAGAKAEVTWSPRKLVLF